MNCKKKNVDNTQSVKQVVLECQRPFVRLFYWRCYPNHNVPLHLSRDPFIISSFLSETDPQPFRKVLTPNLTWNSFFILSRSRKVSSLSYLLQYLNTFSYYTNSLSIIRSRRPPISHNSLKREGSWNLTGFSYWGQNNGDLNLDVK